jgi:diguanylate cyclase (GGDEF)-like protein
MPGAATVFSRKADTESQLNSRTYIRRSLMSQSRPSQNPSLDVHIPALAAVPEEDTRSGWLWPGRAIAMLRACRGVERYVADSSGKSHHLAWAVGSAGLLSAGLFLLMKRVQLFRWPGRSSAHPTRSISSAYDSVTGLPTKRLFMTLAGQALARARRSGRHVAILMVELDQFVPAEDLHEPLRDNLVYRVQAARLKSALRTTDTVARLGECSFAALIEDMADGSGVAAVAEKMQAAVSLPFILAGRELLLTSRIGIALSSSETEDAAALLSLATQAMLQAGHEGYVVHTSFPPSVNSPVGKVFLAGR